MVVTLPFCTLIGVPTISFVLPLRTVNETNAHGHWRGRQRRAKQQRGTAAAVMRTHVNGAHWSRLEPITVTLTRIAPSNGLDDDSLPASCKSVRDGIADAINGGQDRTERIAWRYAQARGKPREYAVLVRIEQK